MAESPRAATRVRLEELAQGQRPRLLPRALRGSAVELHDGNRGLRPAGAHAALVVRRALHLPARAAPDGTLAALRGRVPRQPGPRVSRGQQLAAGEHAGHGARARPRGLREEQRAVQAQSGAGRLQDRRAGGRARARRSVVAVEQYGQDRVEQVLDAALALEAHIDAFQPCAASAIRSTSTGRATAGAMHSRIASTSLPGDPSRRRRAARAHARPIPPTAERDLLWFIAEYAPELEEWERDIFRAVREESFYFYPVFACQIMNEGWASYWHARLLREADFLPQNEYLDAIKTHSDVVRPHAAEQQASLVVNPYHLGFSIWESIVEEHGLERAFEIRAEDDDFGFIRNHLTQELAEELKLFRYEQRPTAACACSSTTSTRCARRSSRRSTTSARPRCSRSTSRRRLARAIPRARDRRPRPRRRPRRARARLHAQGVAPADRARDDRRRPTSEGDRALLNPFGPPDLARRPNSGSELPRDRRATS